MLEVVPASTPDAPIPSGALSLDEAIFDAIPGCSRWRYYDMPVFVRGDQLVLLVSGGPQAQIEPPEPGSYFMAVTVEEDAFDASPRLVSIAETPLSFPLPEAPSQADIRRRVASAVPCGALFVQFSLVTFVGLCITKLVTRATRRAGPSQAD
jgi:hypothetical protein